MDARQIAFVRAALADELAGLPIPPEVLDRAAVVATKAAITWVLGAFTEGMIEGVHVDTERPE